MNSLQILDVRIDALAKTRVLSRVNEWLRSNSSHTLYTPNPEMLVDAHKDETFREILNASDINVCDGTGVFLAGLLQRKKIERITGIDLMKDVCALAEKENKTIYLLGAGETGGPEATKQTLETKFPSLRIVGTHAGPRIQKTSDGYTLNAEGQDTLVEDIIMSAPDILFVAFGHGKQEWWIHEYVKDFPSVRLAMGVGGSFDFIAGTAKRAPQWMRTIGMEWLYRLFLDPKRLYRIAKAVVVFPLLILDEVMKRILPKQFAWYHHLGLFVVTFLLLFSRRPDVLLNAQFWAEDGTYWFANAYNSGILTSLFSPHTGYFQTISRLTASIGQFLPLLFAPLFFNLVALIIKIVPVHLLFSRRFSDLLPSIYSRILLALIYIGLPNSAEVFGNVTNAHWHLAIISFLIIIAKPAMRVYEKVSDTCLLILAGLSGPFCLFVFPFASWNWWKRKTVYAKYVFFLVLGTTAVQTISLLLTAGDTRTPMALGATVSLFVKIVTMQVAVGSLIGTGGLHQLQAILHNAPLLDIIVQVGVFGFLLYLGYQVFTKAPTAVKQFALFGLFVLSAALVSPGASRTIAQWEVLAIPGAGNRYWFIPMLAFLATLLWWMSRIAYKKWRIALYVSFFCVFSLGIVYDWRYPAWQDLSYAEHIEIFQHLESGSRYTVPIQPSQDWGMTLIKK